MGNKKHGAEKTNETDIICKHFLNAVENNKYGWFWECPEKKAGRECKYKHALPPGFVLKKDKMKKKKDFKDTGATHGMSGRDMFMMDPNILSKQQVDDDDDEEDFDLTREQVDDGVKVH